MAESASSNGFWMYFEVGTVRLADEPGKSRVWEGRKKVCSVDAMTCCSSYDLFIRASRDSELPNPPPPSIP